MATSSKPAKDAPQVSTEERVTLIVACPSGRRFRAGLQFGQQPVQVSVSPAQAEQIQADPLLSVSAA